MRRSTPWLLWRHMTGDLCRLLVLTSSVLVSVIAFAAAVKPLADGKLGPAGAISFMVLAVPPMLAYALPFAGGFAATLVYHRMGQDNELLAAHAGGVAHRAVLVPALATGVALLALMACLNELVIPRFLRSMESLVAQDLTKLMISSFRRGQALEHDDLMVFADQVLEPSAEKLRALRGEGVTDAVELRGVVFAERGGDGRIRNEAVVSRAEMYVAARSDGAGSVRRVAYIFPRDGAAWSEDGTFFTFQSIRPITIDIPNAFRDDPQFLTWSELRALRSNPDRMDFIRVRSRDLAHHLAERETTAAVRADLQSGGRVTLEKQGEPFVLRASDIRWDAPARAWRVEPLEPGGAVEVERWRSGEGGDPGAGGMVQLAAARAFLETSMGGDDRTQRELTMRLRLEDVRVDAAPGDSDTSGAELSELTFEPLRLRYDPLPELLGRSAEELLEIAGPRTTGVGADGFLVPPTNDLREALSDLSREITSKQHERWALASASMVMVLTGAVTSIRLRAGPPLPVYLWCFFPALGAVIAVEGGQQLTHEAGAPGLVLLWSGVAALAGYTLLAYLGVRRH